MTPPLPSPDDLRRQVQAHLAGLQSAGVEWLRTGPPLESAPALADSETAGPQGGSRRLDPPYSEMTAAKPAPAGLAAAPYSAAGELSIEERRQSLKVLAAEVAKCTRCAGLAATRTQTVFADGGPGVEICFVGEAPGADEDAQGLPFVGAAGQLLNKIIAACGMKREEVYICNIIKCRPPGNRTPLPDEAANCRGFLERQLELVRPKFIVALGGCAATNLLGTNVSIGKLRGKFHDFKDIPVMVTYHPAYLLPHRAPDKKRDVWEDMQMLLRKMGRPIPQKKE